MRVPGFIRRSDRGAAAVEFALVLPIAIVATIGAIDSGRMVVARSMLTYASICGARAGVANKTTNAAAAQSTAAAAAPMLGLSTTGTTGNYVTVATSSAGGWTARQSGDTITAIAHYTFRPTLPGLTLLRTKNFVAQSTMTIP